MPSWSAKRVAALAVLRYGADRARVRRELENVLRCRGEAADMLAALVGQRLLTPEQARELGWGQENAGSKPSPDRPAAQVPLETQSLGGFRLLRRLGEGSMGAVYVGYHEGQSRQVAVKVLADVLALNPACIAHFYRESKSSAVLSHPHLVGGITAGRDEATGKHYLVREFVDGLSGQHLLERLSRLPIGVAVHIVLDVARALEYLQERRLVHRDVKPDNILLSRSGVAKLADLGLLQRIGAPCRPGGGHGFGTSYYMPYEQATNSPQVDGRSDIYALGVTLYQFLTGNMPFPGDDHLDIVQKKALGIFLPASVHNSAVPVELDRILQKMLACQPQDRYASASDLIVDLERCGLATAPTSAPEIDTAFQGPMVRTVADFPNQITRPDFQAGPPTDPTIPAGPDWPAFPASPASGWLSPSIQASLRNTVWPVLVTVALASAVVCAAGMVLSRLVLAS